MICLVTGQIVALPMSGYYGWYKKEVGAGCNQPHAISLIIEIINKMSQI